MYFLTFWETFPKHFGNFWETFRVLFGNCPENFLETYKENKPGLRMVLQDSRSTQSLIPSLKHEAAASTPNKLFLWASLTHLVSTASGFVSTRKYRSIERGSRRPGVCLNGMWRSRSKDGRMREVRYIWRSILSSGWAWESGDIEEGLRLVPGCVWKERLKS